MSHQALIRPPYRRFREGIFILLFLLMHSGVFSQQALKAYRFNIHVDNINVGRLGTLLKRQAHCGVYIGGGIEHLGGITIHATGILADSIAKILRSYGISLETATKTIFIKPVEVIASADPALERGGLAGHTVDILVLNERQEFLSGTTIMINWSKVATRTHRDGLASIYHVGPTDTLVVTHAGYKRVDTIVGSNTLMTIILRIDTQALGETVVSNYYAGPGRLLTGNVAIVNAVAIDKQPVSNPMLALQGLVPGLSIKESSGFRGAPVSMRLRIPGSIDNGKELLVIIDHVPFYTPAASMGAISTGNSSGGFSPWDLLDGKDIDNVQVLKDADATAIYGSRGANGVILITTKRAKAGMPVWHFSGETGYSGVTRVADLLHTAAYLSVRNEALVNDKLSPSTAVSPDLQSSLVNNYVNHPAVLTGGWAPYSKYDVSVGESNTSTNYRLAAHYLLQRDVFPGSLPNSRGGVHGNLTHSSHDGRLVVEASGIFTKSHYRQFSTDPTLHEVLLPNAPSLRKPTGEPVFRADSMILSNYYADMSQPYQSVADNLVGDVYMRYSVVSIFTTKLNIGYNHVHLGEESRNPIASQDPMVSITGSTASASTDCRSYIIEPQLERRDTFGGLSLYYLAGVSQQVMKSSLSKSTMSGFSSDLELGQPAAALSIKESQSNAYYKYSAIYGRVTADWDHTYILSLTGRRDGSSRFGPGRQFGNFGAVGAVWIFSKAPLIFQHLPWLSFGKLRVSAGVTGNDQIGDYKYRTFWNATSAFGGGAVGYYPANLANAHLAWEKVVKREIGLDIGILRDRLFFSAVYYDNQASHQLIKSSVPLSTGFSTEIRNAPVTVVSSGWEFSLQSHLINQPSCNWTVGLNLTVPRNRLARFPGLASSYYANNLVLGQSINVIRGYRLLDVDPDSGIYRFYHVSTDQPMSDSGRLTIGNSDPVWFGGFSSQLRLGGWEIYVSAELVHQTGLDFQGQLFGNASPGELAEGMLSNQTYQVLNRWQQAGDKARYQRYTTSDETAAGKAMSYYLASSGMLANASFLRLKNIVFSRLLPATWLQKLGCSGGKIYIASRNILTLTPYKGTDPETQSLGLPPLWTVAIGLQITIK